MTNEEILNHLKKLKNKNVEYSAAEWKEICKDKPLHIPMNEEMLCSIITALEVVKRLEETYHNFLGYDLEKCVKYGNKNSEQAEASYSTVMMYEVAIEFENILDDYLTSEENINFSME